MWSSPIRRLSAFYTTGSFPTPGAVSWSLPRLALARRTLQPARHPIRAVPSASVSAWPAGIVDLSHHDNPVTPSCLPCQGTSKHVYYDLERSRKNFDLRSRSRGDPSTHRRVQPFAMGVQPFAKSYFVNRQRKLHWRIEAWFFLERA